MADILDKFIEKAKENVASGYYSKIAKYSGNGNSLLGALKKNNFSLICEIKHASPAGEYSYEPTDAIKLAVDFRDSGADAISVVVEPQIFRGRLSNVAEAKQSGLPVLFKDFVIDYTQIRAAKASGADAMLLVVKVANRLGLDLGGMIADAHRQGLEILLESYDSDELKQAMKTDADILGVNNRDLQTLKVDLSRTGRVIEGAGGADRPIISESGVLGAEDVRYLRKFNVNGVLVGTAIWKAKNVKEKIKELKSGAN
jgi:indole-3-glycerol phosphate synthase